MPRRTLLLAATLVALPLAPAAAQTAAAPAAPTAVANAAPADAVAQGRRIYTSNCARCHGLNMVTTGAAFDLRTFPGDQKDRFVRSVTQGVRAMPAWGDRFKADEIDALWAYVTASR